jgi:hypothetical protein
MPRKRTEITDDMPATRQEAQRLGKRYYYTGKPCTNDHLAPRRVTNKTCMECQRIASKKRQQEIREGNPTTKKVGRPPCPHRKAAIEAGEFMYKNGKDCINGHVNPWRNSYSTSCLECNRKYQKNWIAKQPKKPKRIVPRKKSNLQIAKENGDKLYDGRECKYGHGTRRYTVSKSCVECDRLSKRKNQTGKPPIITEEEHKAENFADIVRRVYERNNTW